MTTPILFQDAKDLLTKQGFVTSNTWYHGTSSALIDSIKEHGLKRSGDQVIKAAAKKVMATIGNHYIQSVEPVFLTQSKQLAYYWAQQACC
jgi:RNA:NAD 2'-phosphotransferase (TPT1/KptA family)